MTSAEILEQQREYFLSGATLDVEFRKKNLKLLKDTIIANQQKIFSALKSDLNKTEEESYMSEVGLVLAEIDYQIKHLKKWAKPKRVKTDWASFPAKTYSVPYPKGNVLILSPWNYPFMLTMEPLVDALSAGNTAIVKPSAYSPATSQVIFDLLQGTFENRYVWVTLGSRAVNQELLDLKVDHIFFTGSKGVGHEVLRRAEPNMATVTLELGGKSPCIVDKSANIALSAKRIVFGKFLNVGQTCVAPDYVLVHKSMKDILVRALSHEIQMQYGTNPLTDETYGKMIDEKHFAGALDLLKGQKIAYGGKSDLKTLKIDPTIVLDPKKDSTIMTTEIFAPILPVLSYETNEEALEIIRNNDTPLALYVFAKDKSVQDFFVKNVKFGGGCINDTIMQVASPRLAFGGVGESGFGAYHGKRGFDTFSHYKNIVKRSTMFDVNIRYRPITKKKYKLIKKVVK